MIRRAHRGPGTPGDSAIGASIPPDTSDSAITADTADTADTSDTADTRRLRGDWLASGGGQHRTDPEGSLTVAAAAVIVAVLLMTVAALGCGAAMAAHARAATAADLAALAGADLLVNGASEAAACAAAYRVAALNHATLTVCRDGGEGALDVAAAVPVPATSWIASAEARAGPTT